MEEVDSGYRLQRLSNLAGRCCMVSLDKDMDVIGHDFHLSQFPAIHAACLSNDAFQFNRNRIREYGMAILWAEDDVVSERENRMVA